MPPILLRYLGILSLGLTVACGGALSLSPLPSQGGPGWIELESPHFVLWAGVPAARAQKALRLLEQRRELLLGIMKPGEIRSRTLAVLLPSQEEMQVIWPDAGAFALSRDNPAFQPLVVFAADSLELTIGHELAHAISFSIVKNQPRWFSEGLASFFESSEPSEKRGTVAIGYPSRLLLQMVRVYDILPSAKLLACREMSCSKSPKFYATSWLLFSYLLGNHHERFGIYMGLLNQATSMSDLDRAWRRVFPELTPARLDLALADFISSGQIAVLQRPLPTGEHPITERPLRDADVLAVRSLLFWCARQRDATLASIDAALAAEPLQPLALMVNAFTRGTYPLEVARATAAAHPDDWRAALFLARALDGEDESINQRVCELSEDDAELCRLEPEVPEKPEEPAAPEVPAAPTAPTPPGPAR